MKKTVYVAFYLGLVSVLSSLAFSENTTNIEQHIQNNLKDLQQEQRRSNFYKAHFPNLSIAHKAAISFHAQVIEAHYQAGYLIMELQAEDIIKLEAFKFRLSPARDFIAKRQAILKNIEQNYQKAIEALNKETTIPPQALTNNIGISSIAGYSCYQTVEETFSEVNNLLNNYPNFSEWIDVGDSWEKKEGLGGYDIFVLKLTNKNNGGEKPKLFINSAIHAREYTTAPLNLAFAKWLLEGYGENADATWLLDYHEIHLMLQTNPDGRKRAEAGILWRKNTNQSYCGSNSSSRGVDLNRNFTFSWNITNGQGSSANQCSATYRGPSAASEPETQALETYVRSLWPDRRGSGRNDAAPTDTSGIHLDIHSYSELVLWPWGDSNSAAPNGDALRTLGRKFAFFNGYSPTQSIGLYPTDGTSDSVSYGELGVAAFTFELGTAFFQNCSTFENTILPDNLRALVYAAKVVRSPYVTPGGPDIINLSLSDNASVTGVSAGTEVILTGSANDTRYNNSNGTETSQNISAVEYYIGLPPWETGAEAVAINPSDGTFDSSNEVFSASIDTSGFAEDNHIIYVRGRDATGTWGAVSAIYLTIGQDVEPVDPTPMPTPPITYCSAVSNNGTEEWIADVSIGNFSNSSGSASYSDFTASLAAIELRKGSRYDLSLSPEFAGTYYNEYWKVWIDLNGDGDFNDTSEEVYSSGIASANVFTGNLSIPVTAVSGTTRLRVAMRYNSAPTPCGTFNYGEVEDYTLIIID